jgi:cell wall-associated NlpC family hydrolase
VIGFMDELAKFQYIKDRASLKFHKESSFSEKDKEDINILISTGSKIVHSASEAYKVQYVEGGRNLQGLDDLGLVLFALEGRGYKIPYNTTRELLDDQYGLFSSTLPRQTEDNELQPGDIVFFADTYGIENFHLGIVVDPYSKQILTTRIQRPKNGEEDSTEKEVGYVEILRWDKSPFYPTRSIYVAKRIVNSSYKKYADEFLGDYLGGLMENLRREID